MRRALMVLSMVAGSIWSLLPTLLSCSEPGHSSLLARDGRLLLVRSSGLGAREHIRKLRSEGRGHVRAEFLLLTLVLLHESCW